MAKITINDVTSGYVSTTAINTAFTAIETALENTLSRDGTSPNSMSANLDMNGYAILNQRATSGNENFTWEGTWVTGTAYAVNNLVYAPEGTDEGATLICVTAHTAGATLNGDSAKWAVFAQRGASGAGSGDVVGPASATANSLARFSGTTGKLLKDGAVIGTDVMAYDAGLAATTAFAKTVLDDADAATARTTLGAIAATDQSVAKAWGRFDGTGTPTFADSYGVSASITDGGAGVYTITISPAMASTNYTVVTGGNYFAAVVTVLTTSTFKIEAYNSSTVATDFTQIGFAVFGDQ